MANLKSTVPTSSVDELEADDALVSSAISQYSSLAVNPPLGKYTVLSSIALSRPDAHQVVSIGSGCKCLPTGRLPPRGDALHDSHAEVLSRRGAIRWFAEEAARFHATGRSQWIARRFEGKFALRKDMRLVMYISTIPCGDASTCLLASVQDEAMATLKDSTVWPSLPANTASRGRDNYGFDKIAAWNVLGIQGALFSGIFEPIYIDTIIIGEVDMDKRDIVKQDCERAFYGRLSSLQELPPGYALHRPQIKFTSVAFPHSRSSVSSLGSASSCNESLCWIADSVRPCDVLINGCRRGVRPKHQQKSTARPLLCKLSLFNLCQQVLALCDLPSIPDESTYHEVKRAATEYQAVKNALQGEGASFAGWAKSGRDWESFDTSGSIVSERSCITTDSCRSGALQKYHRT